MIKSLALQLQMLNSQVSSKHVQSNFLILLRSLTSCDPQDINEDSINENYHLHLVFVLLTFFDLNSKRK